MGAHVIPQCLVTARITIKLQLTGKSHLIFKLYSVTTLRAHMNRNNYIFIANHFGVFNLVTKP